MKIIGGFLRGRNFYMPAEIRTTQNMVRKAVFDLLGQDMSNRSFLDLFAGSGGMGLEAYSRGAASVTFVEKNKDCYKTIEENIALLSEVSLSKVKQTLEVIHNDSFVMTKQFALKKRVFDIVYVDPPYGIDLAKKALKTLGAYVILHSTSTLIIQHDRREKLPQTEGELFCKETRSYGSTQLDFYTLKKSVKE
jgi:16S rRNA (guanine966-N2)-methyltransferase